MARMKPSVRTIALMVCIAALSACNLPAGQSPTQGSSVQAAAATIVAATLGAATSRAATEKAPGTTPFASPMPAATSGVAPTLLINVQKAFCRGGPGPDFKVIATFSAGMSLPLVGQDTPDSFWIVTDPTTGQQCWVSVQDATPTGNYQSLPQVTPQPVTIAVPGKPSRATWNFSCDNTSLTTILGWNPTTGSVNGYRIYRQGSQIADVPASQTSYTEKVPFTYGGSMQYAVAAYNEAGVSQQLAWNFHCP